MTVPFATIRSKVAMMVRPGDTNSPFPHATTCGTFLRVAPKVKETAAPYAPYKHVRMGDRGRVVIPADVRERASLKPGDRLVFVVDDDGWVKMTTWSNAVRGMVGMLKDVAPGRSLVDELIAERRAEAACE